MARTEEGIVLEPTKSADVRDEQGIKEPQVMATDIERGETAPTQNQTLNRGLQGRHMQMIAIGGSIGAGLFVTTGGALFTGGPAALFLGYVIIGVMILLTVHALGELAVHYPINGAYYTYCTRFIDPSWGFAIGWTSAIGWLIVLPFEITAAGVTISYWHTYNISIWIAVFIVPLIMIQWFGVKGYGEVEYVLGMMKLVAVLGFIIFGIIVDCGGVPTDDRGYIGFRYWNDAENGNTAFRNGFKGFCTVFIIAAFSFSGTEFVGLAAAEAANPRKALPKATKQVIFRIAGMYLVSSLILGLIVPNGSPELLGASGANTRASPFVLAIKYAGVKGLPSVFNVVICLSVLSVANSCTYGSTRLLQALAADGMAPKFLAYVDKAGRPIWPVIIQILFGFLAFANLAATGTTVLSWLLAVSGLTCFFVWGSICICHIRFRMAWKHAGRSITESHYSAPLGVYGSYVSVLIVVLCLAGTLYTAIFPLGGKPNAKAFFNSYLAALVTIFLLGCHKVYTRTWRFGVNLAEVDLDAGSRAFVEVEDSEPVGRKTWGAVSRSCSYRAAGKGWILLE